MFILRSEKNNTVNKLRTLHDKMFPPGRSMNGTDRSKEYEMDAGSCFAWHMYTAPDGAFAVDQWFNSKGSKFPVHNHNETECIVVKSGRLVITYEDGEEVALGPGESLLNPPGRPHYAYFPVDTHYYTIMIPSSEQYPQG